MGRRGQESTSQEEKAWNASARAEDRGSKARERVPLIAILSYRFRHPVRDQSCVWRFLSPLASQLALTERRRLVW